VINAWDRAEVKVVAVKTADSTERLADVQIKVDSKPDSVSIETEYPDWKAHNGTWHNNGKMQVDYELTVPRGAELNQVETVNGSVTLGDFTNYTKVSAVNGHIKATNLRGTANLSTVNGEVFAISLSSTAAAKFIFETVNGRVNLSIRPTRERRFVRTSSTGRSQTRLAYRSQGSVCGPRSLRPTRPVESQGTPSQVKLNSVNGPLTINRNKDGKTLSLLQTSFRKRTRYEIGQRQHMTAITTRCRR
jgi:DUF4097 and DUF4098 domain-containing protein YvlB